MALMEWVGRHITDTRKYDKRRKMDPRDPSVVHVVGRKSAGRKNGRTVESIGVAGRMTRPEAAASFNNEFVSANAQHGS